MTDRERLLRYVSADPPDDPAEPVVLRAEWRPLADGVELVVPPPARWRQVILPAVVLALLTGPVVYSIAWLVVDTALFNAGPGLLLSRHQTERALAVGVAAPGAVAWAWQAAVLRRTGRRWRRPSLVRVAGGTLSVEAPEGGPPRVWPVGSVSSVQLSRRTTLVPRFVPRIRFCVATDGGKVDAVLIRWRGGDDLHEVERRLRAALGLGRRNLSPVRQIATRT